MKLSNLHSTLTLWSDDTTGPLIMSGIGLGPAMSSPARGEPVGKIKRLNSDGSFTTMTTDDTMTDWSSVATGCTAIGCTKNYQPIGVTAMH